ncbi:hypothetical protein H1Q59_00165 [Holosporaceae bacterium 'Namur']|nr:hypothetical protein [Holosporaceae bacterium 'Namur']
MALNQDKILKFIEEGNFQGLQSYLNKNYHDTDSLILPEAYINAFNKFIKSDVKHITNSYKIIELLYQYFTDANGKIKYDNSQEYEGIKGLFKIYEKTSAGKECSLKDAVAVTEIKDFKIDSYRKKFELYQEKQTLRNVYKKADDLIERDLIYKIKYPENTSFIRKLLRIPPRRKSEDIESDFKSNISDMILKLREEIGKDAGFKGENGELLLSPSELNRVIYERILLKATKQLGLSQDLIDRTLMDFNNIQVSAAIKFINSTFGKERAIKAGELGEIFEWLVPPHLLNMAFIDINVRDKTAAGKIMSEAKRWFNKSENTYEKYNKNFTSVIEERRNSLEQQAEYYKDKPGREHLLEETLKGLITYNKKLENSRGHTALESAKIEEYKQLLENTQKKLNTTLEKDNTKKRKPKNNLTAYEKKGFELLSQISYLRGERLPEENETSKYWKDIYISEQDKRFVEGFLHYAQDNKEFNSRLTNVLKSKSDFATQYGREINRIRSFSYKTQGMESIVHSITKIENILTKIEQSRDHKFNDKEKITLAEMGKLKKFLEIKNIIKLIKDLDNKPPFEETLKFLEVHDKASIITKLEQEFEKNTSHKPGDLVMDVAKRVREYYLNTPDFKDRVRDFMSSYLHAAVADRKKNNEVVVSHVDAIYSKEKVKMSEVLAEKFRVFPDKLIKNNFLQGKLKTVLNAGNEEVLKEKLQEMYVKISTDLHGLLGNENEEMPFDYKRGVRAFAGDAVPSGLGHRGKQNIKDWAKGVLEKKEHIGQKIKDQNGDYIICSEFAAKMTVLCLVELENQLANKIKKEDPTFQMPKGGLLKMPFHEYEDLGKVHPARLVKELSKSGAIEKVPEAEMVKNIIRTR